MVVHRMEVCAELQQSLSDFFHVTDIKRVQPVGGHPAIARGRVDLVSGPAKIGKQHQHLVGLARPAADIQARLVVRVCRAIRYHARRQPFPQRVGRDHGHLALEEPGAADGVVQVRRVGAAERVGQQQPLGVGALSQLGEAALAEHGDARLVRAGVVLARIRAGLQPGREPEPRPVGDCCQERVLRQPLQQARGKQTRKRAGEGEQSQDGLQGSVLGAQAEVLGCLAETVLDSEAVQVADGDLEGGMRLVGRDWVLWPWVWRRLEGVGGRFQVLEHSPLDFFWLEHECIEVLENLLFYICINHVRWLAS